MKNIQEHAGYAEALNTLHRLEAKHAELSTEQQDILAQLRFKEPADMAIPTAQDRALALLDGQELPSGRAEVLDSLRSRELEVRQQLEVIRAALIQQPQIVERQRDAARAAVVALRKKDVDAIWDKWDQAKAALRAALDAENALIDDVLTGGFGRVRAAITSPDWLNRDLAVLDLKADR